jgi:hypothetical protein
MVQLRHRPTEMEGIMQAVATTLTVIRGKLQPAERAAETRSIGPGSEPVCPIYDETGWHRADNEEFIGLRRCECVKEKIRAKRLAEIPGLFQESTFESYRPKNPKQERILALMRSDQNSSLYLTGS